MRLPRTGEICVDIDPEYKRQVLSDVKKQLAAKRRRKEARKRSVPALSQWDSNFPYIVG